MTPLFRGPPSMKECAFRSAPDLTSPTCDTQRGSDPPSPLLGPIHPWFSLTLVSCSQGKRKMAIEKRRERERKNREKENKHKTEDNTEKIQAMCFSCQKTTSGHGWGKKKRKKKKEASRGFNIASNVCL